MTTFTALPREIRNLIYRFLLHISNGSEPPACAMPNNPNSWHTNRFLGVQVKYPEEAPQFAWEGLHACNRQIRGEIIEELALLAKETTAIGITIPYKLDLMLAGC